MSGGVGAVTDEEERLVTPEAFPGRFSSLRGFPEAYQPLPLVTGTALRRAGWWTPGSGAVVSGGLVVGGGHLFVEPMLRFASQVRERFGVGASPMRFVESHPSTIPSFLGVLYGLSDYQTTVVRGALSGAFALRHAVDALRTQRLARALVVASHDLPGRRGAAALCLDGTNQAGGGPEIAIDTQITSRGASEATGLLVTLAKWAVHPQPRNVTFTCSDASFGESLSVTLKRLAG